MTTTNLPHRVAIYGRFSDERQNPTSARDQIKQCESRAIGEGWRIVSRHSDEAISGAVKARPGYQQMRHALVDGEFDVIMAESLDRLSRDQEETSNLYKLCLFHEVRIFTLSEGWISELHVGLSSTINAVYLKQLAEKTRRGQASRIEAGKSGGGLSYGYQIPLHDNGLPKVGELEIVEEEATIIRRIYAEYAKGKSPRAIVSALNNEGVPPPHSRNQGDRAWRANTIHGNRRRGTGIINNELYIGRRIWNRQRYVHTPGDKRRVARMNPESEWRIQDVPQLRIVSDELWEQVRERQKGLDAVLMERDKGDRNHLSGSQAVRRPKHLLSGLVKCGCCGGPMTIGGAAPKRYYCANARDKGHSICKGMPGILRESLEAHVLNGLRDHLMTPEAIAEFIQQFQKQQQLLDTERRDRLSRIKAGLSKNEREIANIMTAIKAGIFTASTKAELEALETIKASLELDLKIASEAAPAVRDDLSEVYRDKVKQLVASLNDPEVLSEATDAIRGLVNRIVVHWDATDKEHSIEIIGELAALLP